MSRSFEMDYEREAFDYYMEMMLRNNDSECLGLFIDEIYEQWWETYRFVFTKNHVLHMAMAMINR